MAGEQELSASALAVPPPVDPDPRFEDPAIRLEDLGDLVPVGRPGGQGHVYRPMRISAALPAAPIVVKLYRRPPSAAAFGVLARMIAWSSTLGSEQRAHLHRVTAWPLAIVTAAERSAGIAMYDVSGGFEVPFVMPSGRRQDVLLALEHLLGTDNYLQLRGLAVRLDTTMRTEAAERISDALAFLHRHGIVASDIAPNNLLVAFRTGEPTVCFIDCDSMVFCGRQALAPVETADWQMPTGFSELAQTRASDAYKLGLVILRLFARSHDARQLEPHARHVPAELRPLLARSLSREAANRPPAGEWQRALRQALTFGGLNERYPGPAPKSIPLRPPVASVRRPPDPSPSWAPAATRPATQGSARQRSSQQPLSLAWLVIAAVMLLFIFSRLLSTVVPGSAAGSPGGLSGGGQAEGPYQYNYPPSGPGSGGAFR